MTKKTIIIIAISLPIIVLFTMWATNSFINEKLFNEQQAELYDKYMNSSYYYLSDIQNSTTVVLDYAKSKAFRAYSINNRDFNEEFFHQFFDGLKYDEVAWKSMQKIQYLNVDAFVFSPIYDYLNRGCKYRKKEAEAVKNICKAYTTAQYITNHNYEAIIEEVDSLNKELNASRKALQKYGKTANQNRLAWQTLDSIEELNILQRYNERKNWPIKPIIDFFKQK